MAAELQGLDRISESMREPIRQYADQLQNIAGEDLLSLTLYGPIASGHFDPSRHSVRNVLVLSRVRLEALRGLAREGAKLGRRRIAAPIVMTPEYIEESLDTFPLELIEIEHFHVTVLGEDHFRGFKMEERHVRLQCERELKVVLIGLRQGLLAAAGREKLLGALEANAADNLIRSMRGLLWLKGERDPRTPAEIVSATEKMIDRELPGVRAAVSDAAQHGWEQFVRLYEDIEALRKKADAQ